MTTALWIFAALAAAVACCFVLAWVADSRRASKVEHDTERLEVSPHKRSFVEPPMTSEDEQYLGFSDHSHDRHRVTESQPRRWRLSIHPHAGGHR